MARKKPRSRGIGWLAFVLFLAGGSLAAYLMLRLADLPPPAYKGIVGIDVSHHQGEIDWARVKHDGIRFAYLKASEGVTLVDEDFETNWEQSRKQNVLCGAYHFFIPSLDGELQARHFLNQIRSKKMDLPPVLDLEITSGQKPARIVEEALKWMNAVENETGQRPLLYTMPKFADSYLKRKLTAYPLWVVDLHGTQPDMPRGWNRWTIWQYSHRGTVSGIDELVDLNRFNGSEQELKNLNK